LLLTTSFGEEFYHIHTIISFVARLSLSLKKKRKTTKRKFGPLDENETLINIH